MASEAFRQRKLIIKDKRYLERSPLELQTMVETKKDAQSNVKS